MRQDRLGLGVADAIGQSGQRLEAVDRNLMTGGDLRSQAELPERVERSVPEGDDIGPHAQSIPVILGVFHLSPLAGRGRNSRSEFRVRGYRSFSASRTCG